MNNKGDASEIITFVIIIFFLAVGLLVAAFVVDKFKDTVENTPLNETSVSSSIVEGLNLMTTHSIQRGYVLIFGFLIIGMMVSSFLVRVHPVWIFIYILFTAFAVIIAVPLANTYDMLINTSAFQEIASQQTMINWIMQHSIKIAIGAAVLSMVILFSKLPEGSSPV